MAGSPCKVNLIDYLLMIGKLEFLARYAKFVAI